MLLSVHWKLGKIWGSKFSVKFIRF